MKPVHRVVIVGGGFGGLNVARALRKANVRVTLLDRHNYHLFQPLLYQVAAGTLSPANIASPLRSIFRKQKNCEVLLAEVTGFDPARRKVILRDGEQIYDTLVIAAGARHSYFGRDEWEPLAPGLKKIDDATEIRRRILFAFEAAEREPDPERRKAWLRFVIVGAGPTGVELAGTLSEVARFTLRPEFRHIDSSQAEIILVDASDRVLGAYPPDLSEKALGFLKRLKIVVRPRALVTDIRPSEVAIKTGDHAETIQARTILWAAGVQASPLSRALSEATGVQTDRAGRVMVEADCTIPGHPEIFVIGDMTHYSHLDGKPLPGVAPVAIQQGQFVGNVIKARLDGTEPPKFRYRDYGNMAVIGRRKAIAQLGGFKFAGFFAWVLWLFVHVMQIVTFTNRVLILIQWGWSYVTWNRAARLITGPVVSVIEHDVTPETKSEERISIGQNPQAGDAAPATPAVESTPSR